MANQKKHKRRKNSRQNTRLNLAPGVGQEIVAILLVALAIMLTVAALGAGGFLLDRTFAGLRGALGLTTYVLPLVLVFLAWHIFQAEEARTNTATYIGTALVLLAVSGLLHLRDVPDPLLHAQAGNGGGLTGYVLRMASLSVFNVAAASIALVAVMLIGLMLALNIRLTQVIRWFQERRRRAADTDDFSQAAERSKETDTSNNKKKMKINTQVPLESSKRREQESGGKEEAPVLVTNVDPDWELPPLDLLEDKQAKADAGDVEENAKIIQRTLDSFSIDVDMESVNVGPTVTQYTLKPPSGVKLTRITELDQNLAHDLAASQIRVEAPIPGKSAVGVEVPNKKTATVRMREMFQTDAWKRSKSPLSFVLGRDVAGEPVVTDLSIMPHMLIAGATNSGKSVMINSLLTSLLYRNSPSRLKLILVDPKQVELSPYRDIPHLLSPIITEPERCVSALKWAIAEMDRRYSVFAEEDNRNIAEYNASNREGDEMPYIVIVIDELADFMMKAAAEVESAIVRLAQKARATGIHLVLATQRPSVNVITGLIKANIPARVAFSTIQQVDSRTIIDQAGAEKLLGNGDMLFLAPSQNIVKPKRIQGVYVDKKEVLGVNKFLRDAQEPDYNEEVLNQNVSLGSDTVGGFDTADDSLFEDAAQIVIESGKASASLLQRRLRVGYARAARLIDLLEERGVVGPQDGSRPREVLVNNVQEVTGEETEPPQPEDTI